MAIGLEDKKAIVAEVNEAAQGTALIRCFGRIIAVVTAGDMTGLRKASPRSKVFTFTYCTQHPCSNVL